MGDSIVYNRVGTEKQISKHNEGLKAVVDRMTLGVLEVILTRGIEWVLKDFVNLSAEERRDFPNVAKAVDKIK